MIHLGTCAWNFEDWQDVFYPASLASNQQLPYYAHYLSAVEIDSTFYSIPRADVVANWADRTPDDFVFTAKMPRQITHEARLRNCRRELDAFLNSLRPMGEKLGAVLIQFSPGFRPVHDEDALREFLGWLPAGRVSFAVEFRHPDWHQPRVVKLLHEHGVAWTWNDLSPLETQDESPFSFLPQTGDFLYVRLMGDLETKFRPGRRAAVSIRQPALVARNGAGVLGATAQEAPGRHPQHLRHGEQPLRRFLTPDLSTAGKVARAGGGTAEPCAARHGRWSQGA